MEQELYDKATDKDVYRSACVAAIFKLKQKKPFTQDEIISLFYSSSAPKSTEDSKIKVFQEFSQDFLMFHNSVMFLRKISRQHHQNQMFPPKLSQNRQLQNQL